MRSLRCVFSLCSFVLVGASNAQAEEILIMPDVWMSDLKMPTHPQDINCYIPKYETGEALDLHHVLEIIEITKKDGSKDHIFACFEQAANGEPDIDSFTRSILSNRSRIERHLGPSDLANRH